MGKDKDSDDWNPMLHAGWVDEEACEHGSDHYRMERFEHIEVKMCTDTRRVWSNVGRTFLGIITLGATEHFVGNWQDITHEAIQTLTKCTAPGCGREFTLTMDIMNATDGKLCRAGHYATRFGKEDWINSGLDGQKVARIYDGMWDGDKYDEYDHNCKHWARDFMSYVRAAIREG